MDTVYNRKLPAGRLMGDKHAKELFREGLRGSQSLSPAAELVLASALRQVKVSGEKDIHCWGERYLVEMIFTDPWGKIIETTHYQHHITRIDANHILAKELLVIVTKRAIYSAAKDGTLIAKLCLLYSEEILHEERLAPSGRFNPDKWGETIVDSFKDSVFLGSSPHVE